MDIFLIMHNYKIGLLIFSKSNKEGPALVQLFEKVIQAESFGALKAVQLLDHNSPTLNSVLEDYKNTNLGMIILVAPDADHFFPYSELEEVGQKNEKYLVTLNLDENIEKNFIKIIQKVKSSSGKPKRGCDSSCR